MIFRIGPWTYRVKIKDDLRDEQGKEVAGLCEWTGHVIWINGELPVRRRLSVLLHELQHAWQMEFGTPRDSEGLANQIASFTADVWRQLERRGGEGALMRLDADGIIDQASGDPEMAGEPRPMKCKCGGYLELPYRDGGAAFDAKAGRLAMSREGDCSFCGHTVFWQEAVTSAGRPTNQIISGPLIMSPAR